MAFRRKRQEDLRIDITPMVDVVFLLLIFFMISTTFVETSGIDIKLPESSARQVESEPEEIRVYLSRGGDIFVRDEQMSLADLKRMLAGYGDRTERTTFLLMADRLAQHGRVVELMDAARAAGFSRLAIGTEPAAAAP